MSSETYSYDAMGNRTDHGGNYTTGNRVGSFNGVSHYYDLDGNVIEKYDGPTGYFRQYWWNAENQLDSAQKSGWYREKHDYNAFGKPVRTFYAEATNPFAVKRYLLWDGDALIADFTPNGQRESDYVYLPGTIDHPFAVTTGATTPSTLRFNEVDELGNVLGTSDAGLLSQSNTYDPWGKLTISGNSDSHLFWKGLFWHGDVTGLVYMRNRWYDQETGRFVNENPAGFAGGINLYAFAGNDPINGSDPSGLCIIPEDFWKTVAAAEEGEWSYNCTDLQPVIITGSIPADPPTDFPPVGDPLNHGGGASTGGVGSVRAYLKACGLPWINLTLTAVADAAFFSGARQAIGFGKIAWRARGVAGMFVRNSAEWLQQRAAARAFRAASVAAISDAVIDRYGVGMTTAGGSHILLQPDNAGQMAMQDIFRWSDFVPGAASFVAFADALNCRS